MSVTGTEELPGAPAVVAVVVAHDPGPWFEECLRSLDRQDYPDFSVLVIDNGSAEPVRSRVAETFPDAYVRRLDEAVGFSAAANEVLQVVEGADFYLFCHDDVALARDAVRDLVEEAYRSNAGIVGPKLVRWDDPSRLLQVGLFVDKSGHVDSPVERGELDQEQHDAVRDVFCVPGGVTLIRADLFATLGGYDALIPIVGEDLDLCWRAQAIGARVLVAPQAVARHLEALGQREGMDAAERRRLTLRHRLWTVLTNYGRWHRVRVVPQIALLALAEAVYATLAGRRDLARDIVGAWRWAFSHRRELKATQRRLAAARTVPDREVRRLQTRGSARVTAFVRGQLGGDSEDRVASFAQSAGDLAASVRRGPLRAVVSVWAVLALVLVVGTRADLFGSPSSLVDLPPLPHRPWPLLAEWLSGWRTAGLGSEAPQPTAYGLLGFAGSALLGSMGLLRRLLVFGPLLLGPIGAARLAAAAPSRFAPLVAATVYAGIPLPYNAIAEGRWGGLVVWSAMPWIVARVARASSAGPYEGAPWVGWRGMVGLGILTALVAAAVPIAIFVPVVVALALSVGGLLGGRGAGSLRALRVAAGGSLVAAGLHLPWALDFFLPGSTWDAFAGPRSGAAAPGVAELLRFETGPLGAGILSWLFLGGALLALAIGQGWRFRWAVRGWALALAGWALAVVAGSERVNVSTGPIEIPLSMAACGLALASALGVVAFETDLRSYRFGWRQAASIVALVAVLAGCLPVLGGAAGGRWEAPSGGVGRVLRFLEEEQDEAAFRTLWIADAGRLPLGGWELTDGLAWGLTDDGLPTVNDRWVGVADDTTLLVEDALRLASSGETARLGRLLAPMGVRYLVVVGADRPLDDDAAVPAFLVDVFAEQLDLAEVELDPGLRVYRNAAWFSTRAVLPSADAAAAPGGYLDAARRTALDGSEAVLVDVDGNNRFDGSVPDNAEIWFASASSPNWHLDVDGGSTNRREGFGWGNVFSVAGGGPATLEYSTPLYRTALSAAQLLAWLLAARFVIRTRRRGAVP